MKRRIWVLIGVVLAASAQVACVDTVAFSRLSPTGENVGRAIAAERALSHPMTLRMVEASPMMRDRLEICLKSGGRTLLFQARLDGDRVCGIRGEDNDSPPHSEVRVCHSVIDIEAVGLPRDARTIGFYPVRGWLACGDSE